VTFDFKKRMTKSTGFFKHLHKQCINAGVPTVFVNVMSSFERFSKTPQEHAVIVDATKFDGKLSWDEWLPDVLDWVRENTNEAWSIHIKRKDEPHDSLFGIKDKLYVEFSFSDIQDAALFRLRF
jgi:hypothetical protein